MGFLSNIFKKKEKTLFVSKRENQADVYHLSENERMDFAIEKAKLTLNYFKKSSISPKPFQRGFALKAKIVDGENIEHIWLINIEFDDNNIYYGEVNNLPLGINNVKVGQKIGVTFDDVSDWMIIENGKLIGGYTIRAIRDSHSPNERIQFDKNIGLFIDEGVDYFDHDFKTPEGAILCLEDAYDENNLDKAIFCKDFEREAELMIKSKLKDIVDNQEVIKLTAEALQLSFIKFMQENGFPSFKGVTRAFPERLFLNDDLVIITEICIHPDKSKSKQRMYVSRKNNEWRVLNPVD